MYLLSSLPIAKQDMITHCSTYDKARDHLKAQQQDPGAVALTLRSKLMSIPPTNSVIKEENGIRLAVELLGKAMQARPSFYMHTFECISLLNFMYNKALMSVKHEELHRLGKDEAKEQVRDDPNMAEVMYKFLIDLRNNSQSTRAALLMHQGIGGQDLNVMATHMRAMAAQSGETQDQGGNDGHAGGGGAQADGEENEQPMPAQPRPVCNWCDKTTHNIRKMYLCENILGYRNRHDSLPDWLCRQCLQKKRQKCDGSGSCAEWTSWDGQRKGSHCCSTCKVHKNLGTCATCLQSEVKFKEKRLQDEASLD
jgi:hypothetical protein